MLCSDVDDAVLVLGGTKESVSMYCGDVFDRSVLP